MSVLYNFVQSILNLGASAILPIMITILGLFFRMKFGSALKAGLTVGIGFQGLNLVVGLLNTSLEPAISYYTSLGQGFSIMDVGWPAVGAASWAVPFSALIVPLAIIINLLLIRFKLTKTMNVDIWNFIHFLIPGAMTYYLTNNFFLGLTVTLILSVAVLFIADKVRRPWEKYFGLEGTTCTTITFIVWTLPFTWIINKIIDFIPGLNKLDISLEKVNKYLGVLGDPVVIGLFVGIFLGVITKQPFTTIITIGVGISAIMLLMPKMVSVLMEGLSPIGTAAKEFMNKRIGDEADLAIGMDVALGLGDPCVVTNTVLSIPIAIALAFIIPGIEFFPVGMLMLIIYESVFATLTSRGNLLRALISTTIYSAVTMILANWIAPEATIMMKGAGMNLSGLGTDTMFATPWSALIALLYRIFNA